MNNELTTGTFQDGFSFDQRFFWGHNKLKFKGKTRSLLRKEEFDIKSKSRQNFQQIKVNFLDSRSRNWDSTRRRFDKIR